MCGRCSAGSAGSTSGSSGPDTGSCSSARRTATGETCCEHASPDESSETTYARSPMKFQPLKKLTGEQVTEAIMLYCSGLSLAKVATQFGVSRQSMHDLLRRRIALRGRIEALPRKPKTAIRAKRLRTLRRYRSRAARITRAQIRAVFARDRVCVKCGAAGRDVDHIIPVSMGGKTEMANLQLLCQSCHREKTGDELRREVM